MQKKTTLTSKFVHAKLVHLEQFCAENWKLNYFLSMSESSAYQIGTKYAQGAGPIISKTGKGNTQYVFIPNKGFFHIQKSHIYLFSVLSKLNLLITIQ